LDKIPVSRPIYWYIGRYLKQCLDLKLTRVATNHIRTVALDSPHQPWAAPFQKATVIAPTHSGWDVHLRLCQPVEARHKKTKTEATHTTRVQAQEVCSPLSLGVPGAHNYRGQVPDPLPKRKAEGAFVVVSFRPLEITICVHPFPGRIRDT